jgi:hypothetical protein
MNHRACEDFIDASRHQHDPLTSKLAAENTALLEQSYVPCAGRCELARLLHRQ